MSSVPAEAARHGDSGWSPDSWQRRPVAQMPPYEDAAEVERVLGTLRTMPPLVTSWEIERLKGLLADAALGRRFVLQGGDCAETLADCTSQRIAGKLKILLQMSLVLVHGGKRPVVRIGRFAGQYAKPRSSATETRIIDGVQQTLPSYFGDLVNQAEFSPAARRPDPMMMLRGYTRSALTLNFVRALAEGGFADLHHPEYWDLGFLRKATLSPARREEYERTARSLADGLAFMEALGERSIADATRVEFFTSHEGLNLWYEQSQTRRVPRRAGWYDLTCHLPWIGERTRSMDGAHVEFFSGVRNPVGVKLGPSASAADVVELVRRLNPCGEAGKLVFITRLGAHAVRQKLPELVAAVRGCGLPGATGAGVVWMCDPMHGNSTTLASGVKTRSFDAILDELEATLDILQTLGTPLAGVHFELTDEDVTECLGGSAGVREEDLLTHYATACDPRLNYQQSLEMAFLLARRLGQGRESAGFASSGPEARAAGLERERANLPDPRSAGL